MIVPAIMDFHAVKEIAQVVGVLLFAVILHEYAHGWVADRLGDPTAREAGRLSLNPLRHIDPVGTLLVPLVLKLLGFMPLGWAKPVPVDFRRLRNPRRDMLLVAAAGPAVNMILAFAAARLLQFSLPEAVRDMALSAVVVNLILATFNLLPIPPLDGSRILVAILPSAVGRIYARIEPYGIIIVIVLLNLGMLDFIWRIGVFLAARMGIPVSLLDG